MQGEYVIPSIAVIPKSAAEMALMQGAVGQAGQGASPGPRSTYEQANGRWRVQVIDEYSQSRLSASHL